MSFRLDQFNEKTQAKLRAQLEADIQLKNARKTTLVECDSCDAPLEAEEVQRSTGARFLVRVMGRRKRLIDEDNMCEKYHVDLCRYAGVISDDAPERTKIEVSQSKCRKGEPEEITIEVIEL